MFIDASVLCAILLREPEAEAFLDRLDEARVKITSAIAIMETGLRLFRESGSDLLKVRAQIAALLTTAEIHIVAIGEVEADAALDAHDRFGKGRYPARLNVGDCFAYARALTHNALLLFKGEDFALTDVVRA